MRSPATNAPCATVGSCVTCFSGWSSFIMMTRKTSNSDPASVLAISTCWAPNQRSPTSTRVPRNSVTGCESNASLATRTSRREYWPLA